jgi:hypothetical protein
MINDRGSENTLPPPLPSASAGTYLESSQWIDKFVGILLHPRQTLQSLSAPETNLDELPGAMALLVLVFAMDGARSIYPSFAAGAIFSLFVGICSGIVYWLALTGVLAILGASFGAGANRIKSLFAATAWAFTPWIFMSPIFCLRFELGPIALLFAGLIWAWVLVLQMIAVSSVFQMKAWQTAILFLLTPLLLGVFYLVQMAEAIYNCVIAYT